MTEAFTEDTIFRIVGEDELTNQQELQRNKRLLESAQHTISVSENIIKMQKEFIDKQQEIIVNMHTDHVNNLKKQMEQFTILVQLLQPVNRLHPRDEISSTIAHLERLLHLTKDTTEQQQQQPTNTAELNN